MSYIFFVSILFCHFYMLIFRHIKNLAITKFILKVILIIIIVTDVKPVKSQKMVKQRNSSDVTRDDDDLFTF